MVNLRIVAIDFLHGLLDSIKGIMFIRRLLEEESKEVKVEPPEPRERTVLQIRREKQGIFRRPPEPPKKKDSFMKKLAQIYLMNFLFLLGYHVCFYILEFVFTLFSRTEMWRSIGYLLIVPIFIVSRIIQALWFSDISGACMRALNLPPPKSVAVSNMIAETLITGIHSVFFLIQGIVSQYLPIPIITPFIVYLHMALLNSMYCFDYFFDGYNLPFLRRRAIFEAHWPFFLGFGTPLALACSVSDSMFVNGVIFALLFPLFIISSYPANWNRKYEEKIPQVSFCRISYMLTQLVGQFVKSITPTNNPPANVRNVQK